MKYWVDLSARPTESKDLMVGTPAYLEVQSHRADPPGISYTYVTPLAATDFLVSSCWGHEFDRFQEFIGDAKLGDKWISAYGEAWPAFEQLLRNALGGRYASGALVNAEDPDDGERKWHVVTFVGNCIPKETYEEVANDQRIIEACQSVYLRSASLLEQMASGRDLSIGTKTMMLARGAWSGYLKGLDTSLVWIERLSKVGLLQS